MGLVVTPKRCDDSVKKAIQQLARKLEHVDFYRFTASRLIATDTNQQFTSVSDFTNWIAGTANQINVADDGDGTLTLSTPQDIHTGAANFTIAGLTVTGSSVHSLNSAVFQPTTDSTTFFQVLDANGGTPILNVDSTNERVGVGIAAPTSLLQVHDGHIYITGTAAFNHRLYICSRESTADSMNLYTSGANSVLSATGNFKFSPSGYFQAESSSSYILFQTGATNHMYFRCGGDFLFQDVDSANAVRAVLQSNTGYLGLGGESNPAYPIEITNPSPTIALHNSTHEDTDGGRESLIDFKGEQGVTPFEETTLARIQASHDGTGADDKGKLVISTNDGADGDTPTNQFGILSTGDWIINKTSGIGIKVDLSAPTFGFADLLGDQFSKNTGATKPTLAAYNGVVKAWQFSDGDEAYMTYHIPHDYVAGTDIHLHIHWSQNNAGATGGTVDFKYSAIYAKGWNQVSGSTFTATPITDTFSSIDINDGDSGLLQYQHFLTEITISAATATAALFDRDDLEPDGVIELTLEMDANNLTGTPSDPFIHYVDIHYQSTGIMGTKSREPDFYV